MLGAVAGLASDEGVEVSGMDAAAVSYPGFEGDLALAARGLRCGAPTSTWSGWERARRSFSSPAASSART